MSKTILSERKGGGKEGSECQGDRGSGGTSTTWRARVACTLVSDADMPVTLAAKRLIELSKYWRTLTLHCRNGANEEVLLLPTHAPLAK
jgi:hypothetical protein